MNWLPRLLIEIQEWFVVWNTVPSYRLPIASALQHIAVITIVLLTSGSHSSCKHFSVCLLFVQWIAKTPLKWPVNHHPHVSQRIFKMLDSFCLSVNRIVLLQLTLNAYFSLAKYRYILFREKLEVPQKCSPMGFHGGFLPHSHFFPPFIIWDNVFFVLVPSTPELTRSQSVVVCNWELHTEFNFSSHSCIKLQTAGLKQTLSSGPELCWQMWAKTSSHHSN